MTEPKRGRGRPATGKTPVRSVRIGPVWDQARAKAMASGETIADVIERGLAEYVSQD